MKDLAIILTLVFAFGFLHSGCKKENEENETPSTVLTNAYKGQLILLFSNNYPQFSESTSIDVDVDKNGKMVFGIGELQYSGTSNNGQSKIQREGELILAPNGNYFIDDDKIHFAVDENTSVNETMKVWVWDGTDWQLQVNETITDTWNNGLDFLLIDAEISGSVVEASTANGTVKWTLILVPIPN